MGTEVLPFRGFLYNKSKVSIEKVIAPPYDVITGMMQEQLYEKDDHNIVTIDFGKEHAGDNETNNKYKRATDRLNSWIDDNILQKTDNPAYYLCEQHYEIDGTKKVMRGIFGSVKLTAPGEGIYPHEKTRKKPKEDRLNLLSACKANTSPIFSIYNNPSASFKETLDSISKETPFYEFTVDSIFYRFWVITATERVNAMQKAFSSLDIFIADGHHRYETSLEYQKIMTNPSPDNAPDNAMVGLDTDHVMMFLVNIADGGLTVLPTHRLIKTLPGKDPIEPLKEDFNIEFIDKANDPLSAIKGKKQTFALYIKDNKEGFYIIEHKHTNGKGSIEEEIDVFLLHNLLFDKLYGISDFDYEMDAKKTIALVDEDKYEGAVLLNPTRASDVERAAKLGRRMPAKSTYFYPKIPTGLLIKPLWEK